MNDSEQIMIVFEKLVALKINRWTKKRKWRTQIFQQGI